MNEIFKVAEKKHFPKKEFMINKKKKAYAPIIYTFLNQLEFSINTQKNMKKLNISVKFAKVKISPFTDNSNLYKHLNRHKDAYRGVKSTAICTRSGPVIDDSKLLVKYFVSSNSSRSSLENIYLRKFLNKIVGTKFFDDKILPEIYEKLRTKIK